MRTKRPQTIEEFLNFLMVFSTLIHVPFEGNRIKLSEVPPSRMEEVIDTLVTAFNEGQIPTLTQGDDDD